MTTFDNREKAFEEKFARDEGMNFKARARRNRLLGEWVATELLNLEGAAVADYAAAVVKADLEEEGDADVIRKVQADMEGANVEFSAHRIEKKIEELMSIARQQLMDEV